MEGVTAGIAEMKVARQTVLGVIAAVDVLLGMFGGLQDVLGEG